MTNIAILIDLDGTMYAGSRPIPGAAEFIRLLKEQGIPYLYVTNNSSKTPGAVVDHLLSVGIAASAEEVVTSSQAAAAFIVQEGQGNRVYVIGEDGLRTALEAAGLLLVEEEKADYVVQGIDREFNYAKLELGVSHILAGARYILTNPDRLLPMENRLVPAAGAISGAIREATQVQPVIIGKPSEFLIYYALQKLKPGLDVWMAGDNMLTDIAAGAASGLKTALVLTGVTTRSNLAGQIAAAGITPDLICEDLSELGQQLRLIN